MDRRVAVALLLVATLLAGCSGGKAKKADDGIDEGSFDELDLVATKETGVIRGIVIDEAINPIADVNISVVGPLGMSGLVKSNAEGAFGMDGLEPGSYFLTATKPSYQGVQTAVDVVAGISDPDPVKVLLVADPSSVPYPNQYVMEGFITCSARIALTAVPAGECQPSDESQVNYTLDRLPEWAQTEMTWKSTQALGDALSLVSECFSGDEEPDSDPCPNGNLVVNRSEGSAPLIIKFNQTLLHQFIIGEGHDLRLRIFAAGRQDTDLIDEEAHNQRINQTTGGQVQCIAWPAINQGCFRFTGVGVILNQAFKVFTTVFYGYTPPEDWLFIETGNVPQPD